MTDPPAVVDLVARLKRETLQHVANSQEIYRRAERGRRGDFERALTAGMTIDEIASAAGLDVSEVKAIVSHEPDTAA